jgi:hypothetical protein
MNEIINEFYTIATSTGLISLSLKKSWKKVNMGLFLKDWDTAKSEVEEPFNALIDFVKSKDDNFFGFDDPREMQQKLYGNGCKKIAVLVGNVESHRKYSIQLNIQNFQLQKTIKYFFVEGRTEEILEENRLKEMIKAKVWLTV